METEVNDTIVAVATGPGPGGVAIIRLSGEQALSILSNVFRHSSKRFVPRKLTFGTVCGANGNELDDCLAVVMPGPASFTGEDVAEIQCHGGRAIVSDTLKACCAAGARLAEPGEFSRRAFLNGRMDLVQAEALCALIAAESDSARKIALRELKGGLSLKIRLLFETVIEVTALIEAHLDFPDEDIPAQTNQLLVEKLNWAIDEIDGLLAGFERNRRAGGEIRVVLAGEPNAGKSSLFNALLGRERAIVSPHPGTTRDTIEATIEIQGYAVTLIDTAGLRETVDDVERIGIQRTKSELSDADLILHLIPADATGDGVLLSGDVPALIVRSKADKMTDINRSGIAVSVQSGRGLSELERAVIDRLDLQDGTESGSVSRQRHATALEHARQHLTNANVSLNNDLSGDLTVIDLRDALGEIGQILGVRLDEQILDRIFSCILYRQMNRRITVKAHPKSRQEKVLVLPDGTVEIWVREAPDKGKATQAVATALANHLGIAPCRVILITGATSRIKIFTMEK